MIVPYSQESDDQTWDEFDWDAAADEEEDFHVAWDECEDDLTPDDDY